MINKTPKKLIKKHIFDFGVLYIYENFMVTEINEGVILNFEKSDTMSKLGKAYFGNKTPFVYISNRVHSYSFEPTAHFKSSNLFPNLKGYAIVSYGRLGSEVASLEKAFINKPTRIFSTLKEAIDWVDELIVSD